MWCANCQADVATEISADGQSLQCISCGHEIRRVFAPSLHPETQSARELLERWARDQKAVSDPALPASKASPLQVDPIAPGAESAAPTTPAPAAGGTGPAAENITLTPSPNPSGTRKGPPEKPFRPTMRVRIDPGHDSYLGANAKDGQPQPPAEDHSVSAAPNFAQAPSETGSSPQPVLPAAAPAQPLPVQSATPAEQPVPRSSTPHLRLDDPHTSQVPEPHLDVRPFAERPGVLPGRSESFWGQLLAYAGVGGITVGTVFVVWGYFGGVEQYASTGWLIATAGQMLLLLGVVTLISGGMQQTTHEVGARIETLDGRIQRIEQSTHQLLKGPYFARRRRRTANSKRPPAA